MLVIIFVLGRMMLLDERKEKEKKKKEEKQGENVRLLGSVLGSN